MKKKNQDELTKLWQTPQIKSPAKGQMTTQQELKRNEKKHLWSKTTQNKEITLEERKIGNTKRNTSNTQLH